MVRGMSCQFNTNEPNGRQFSARLLQRIVSRHVKYRGRMQGTRPLESETDKKPVYFGTSFKVLGIGDSL
jgi:hypothetical protein